MPSERGLDTTGRDQMMHWAVAGYFALDDETVSCCTLVVLPGA